MTGSASLQSPAKRWEERQRDAKACGTALVMDINRLRVSFRDSNRHNSLSPCFISSKICASVN